MAKFVIFLFLPGYLLLGPFFQSGVLGASVGIGKHGLVSGRTFLRVPVNGILSPRINNVSRGSPSKTVNLDKALEVMGPGLFPLPLILSLIPFAIPAVPLVAMAESYFEQLQKNASLHSHHQHSQTHSQIHFSENKNVSTSKVSKETRNDSISAVFGNEKCPSGTQKAASAQNVSSPPIPHSMKQSKINKTEKNTKTLEKGSNSVVDEFVKMEKSLMMKTLKVKDKAMKKGQGGMQEYEFETRV